MEYFYLDDKKEEVIHYCALIFKLHIVKIGLK